MRQEACDLEAARIFTMCALAARVLSARRKKKKAAPQSWCDARRWSS